MCLRVPETTGGIAWSALAIRSAFPVKIRQHAAQIGHAAHGHHRQYQHKGAPRDTEIDDPKVVPSVHSTLSDISDWLSL
jgi:hypothetical protein